MMGLQMDNDANERRVLSSVLGQPLDTLKRIHFLKPDDFYNTQHQFIYKAAVKLFVLKNEINFITVTELLREEGTLAKAGGADYISELILEFASSSVTSSAAKQIFKASIYRKKLKASYELIECLKNGKNPSALNQHIEILKANNNPDGGEKNNGLVFTTLRELLNEPEEESNWLVDQHLPTGGLSILAGKPKGGKSTLARSLALSIARGNPWLGFKSQQGPVIYLALEEKRSELRSHFRLMGADDDPVFLYVAPSPQDGLLKLRQSVERIKPFLIVVDPLFKFVKVKDANEYAAVTAALEPLLTLARETGAHIMAIHHTGKIERGEGDGILGSTAIYGAVDTAFILKRNEKYRTISSYQRYGEDLPEITLNMDPVSHSVSAGPSRKDADETKMGNSIIKFIMEQNEPVEEKVIHEEVEGRKAVKIQVLRKLVGEDKIYKSGRGGKGDPFKYSCSLVPTICQEQENMKNGV